MKVGLCLFWSLKSQSTLLRDPEGGPLSILESQKPIYFAEREFMKAGLCLFWSLKSQSTLLGDPELMKAGLCLLC